MQLISKIISTIGLLLILIGIFLVWQRNNPNRLAFKTYTPQRAVNHVIAPQRIIIKSINLDLPIITGSVENNKWQTTTMGVSYLSSSPVPGTKGNSILYGHNWNSILGSLGKVRPGDNIEITLNDGTVKSFKINTIGEVTPDQISILSPSNDVRITLYTCSGFWDTKRLVVTAVLNNTISNRNNLAKGGTYHE